VEPGVFPGLSEVEGRPQVAEGTEIMLRVNDTPLEYDEGMTVADILKKKNYVFRMLAVWVNGEFVPRGTYGKAPVPDGADVKIMHGIAGG
jgi:sulfur carrier protein